MDDIISIILNVLFNDVSCKADVISGRKVDEYAELVGWQAYWRRNCSAWEKHYANRLSRLPGFAIQRGASDSSPEPWHDDDDDDDDDVVVVVVVAVAVVNCCNFGVKYVVVVFCT